MSWASKNLFDPIKSLFHNDAAAVTTLEAARAVIDKALASAVTQAVASVMALVPVGAVGLSLEVLDDVIAGLQVERARLASPPPVTPPASTLGS